MKSTEEKTEPATAKRKSEARKKGQIAKSQDFSTAIMLLFGSLVVYFLGGQLVWTIKDTMAMHLGNAQIDNFDMNTFSLLIKNIYEKNMKVLFPILGGFFIISIVGSYTQTGFVLSQKALIPDFKKLNPISGLKNLVNMKSMVKLGMAIIKVSIMGSVAYFAIKKDIEPLMELVTMRLDVIFGTASNLIFCVTLKISIILLILSLLDLLYQRWQHAKNLKMSKYEVKQETKQSEGDPQTKSRVKTIQRQMSNQRMMNEVPEADVVISNPTHYAVAIKYDVSAMNAPKVVAKGVDFLALKIIEIAKENNVPVVEDRILVRIIYNTVEISSEVPPDLYKAVAKVLSYVYQLRNIVGK